MNKIKIMALVVGLMVAGVRAGEDQKEMSMPRAVVGLIGKPALGATAGGFIALPWTLLGFSLDTYTKAMGSFFGQHHSKASRGMPLGTAIAVAAGGMYGFSYTRPELTAAVDRWNKVKDIKA